MYLGSPGRMVGVKCPTRQRVGSSERYSFETTLEGRVKAQVVPLQRRSWDVELGQLTTPSEVATLQEFANGAWGKGPFWFLPADAPVVNVLPPITSVFGGHVDGGPVRLDGGGMAPFSNARSDGSAGTLQFVAAEEDPPVIPEMPVTGSAWVTGAGASVLLQWFDASGSIIGTVQTPPSQRVPAGQGAAVRVSVTGVPPAGAVRARLTARDATAAARPAVTWTDQPFEYGDGQGCQKAVVHAVSRDVTKAWDNPKTGRWSNLSFTVQEVG